MVLNNHEKFPFASPLARRALDTTPVQHALHKDALSVSSFALVSAERLGSEQQEQPAAQRDSTKLLLKGLINIYTIQVL